MSNSSGGGQAGVASASITALGFGALYMYQQRRQQFDRHGRRRNSMSDARAMIDHDDTYAVEETSDHRRSSYGDRRYEEETTEVKYSGKTPSQVPDDWVLTVHGSSDPADSEAKEDTEHFVRHRGESTPVSKKEVAQSYLKAKSTHNGQVNTIEREESFQRARSNSASRRESRLHPSIAREESSRRTRSNSASRKESRGDQVMDIRVRKNVQTLPQLERTINPAEDRSDKTEGRNDSGDILREEETITNREQFDTKLEESTVDSSKGISLDFLKELKKMHEYEIERLKRKSKEEVQAFLNELNQVLLGFCGGDDIRPLTGHNIDIRDLKSRLSVLKDQQTASSAEKKFLQDEVDALRIQLETIQAREELERTELLNAWEVERNKNDAKLDAFKKEAREKFKQDMVRLRDELTVLVEGSEALKAEKEELLLELEKTKEEREQNSTFLVAEKENARNLIAEKESCLKLVENLNAQISKLEKSKKEEIEQLLVDKVELSAEKTSLESKLFEVEEMKQYAEEGKEELVIESEVLKAELEKLSLSNETLEAKILESAESNKKETDRITKGLIAEKEALMLESKIITAKNEELLADKSKMEESYQQDKDKFLEEKQKFSKLTSELKQLVEKLEAEKDEVVNERDTARSKIVKADKEKEELQKITNDLNTKLVEIEARHQEAETQHHQEVQRLESENDAFSANAEALEAKVSDIKTTCQKQKLEIERLKNEKNEALTSEAVRDEETSKREESYKRNLETEKTRVAALESKISEIEETHKREKEQIVKLAGNDKKGLLLETKGVKAENQALKSKIEEIEAAGRRDAETLLAVKADKEKLMAQVSKFEEVEKKLAEAVESRIAMHSELESLKTRCEDTEKAHQEKSIMLSTEREELLKEKKEMQSQILKAETKKQREIDQIRSDKAELAQILDSVQAKLATIEEAHSKETETVLAEKEQLKQQVNQLLSAKEEIAAEKDIVEAKLVEAVESRIEMLADSAIEKSKLAEAEKEHRHNMEQLMSEKEEAASNAKALEIKILSIEESRKKEIERIGNLAEAEKETILLECEAIRAEKKELEARLSSTEDAEKLKTEQQDLLLECEAIRVEKEDLAALVSGFEDTQQLLVESKEQTAQNAKLLVEVDNLKLTISELQETNQRNAAELLEEKQNFEVLKGQVSTLEATNQEIEKLESDKSILETKLMAADKQVEVLHSKLLESGESYQHELEVLTDAKKDLTMKTEALEASIGGLKKAHQEERDRINAQATEYREELLKLKKKLAEIEETQQPDKYEIADDETSLTTAELESLRARLLEVEEIKKTEVEKLSSEIENLTAKLLEADKQNEDLRLECKQLEKDMEALEAKILTIQEIKKTEFANMSSEKENLTAKLLEADKQKEDLIFESKQYKKEVEALEAKIQSIESTREQETARTVTDKDCLKSEVETLKSLISVMEDAHKQDTAIMQAEKQNLLLELEELKDRLAQFPESKKISEGVDVKNSLAEKEALLKETRDATAKLLNAETLKKCAEEGRAEILIECEVLKSQLLFAETEHKNEIDRLRAEFAKREEAVAQSEGKCNFGMLGCSQQSLVSEVDSLTDELKTKTEAHQQEKQKIADLQAECEDLKTQLLDAERKYKSEAEERDIISSKLVEVENMQNPCFSDDGKGNSPVDEGIEVVGISEPSLSKQLAELQARIESDKLEYEDRLQKVHEEHGKELADALAQLGLVEAEYKTSLTERAELQARIESENLEYESRLQKVHEEHGKELDDVLAQLDLVEAEHKSSLTQRDSIVKEKDEAINRLESQLKDSQSAQLIVKEKEDAINKLTSELNEYQSVQSKVKEKDEAINRLESQLKDSQSARKLLREKEEVINKLRSDLQECQSAQSKQKIQLTSLEKVSNQQLETLASQLIQAQEDAKMRNAEIEKLKANYLQLEIDQALTQEKACDQAREETVQLAEKQFNQANEKYKKLKVEFDSTVSKLVALEEEARTNKQTIIEREARQLALVNELAEMKAGKLQEESICCCI